MRVEVGNMDFERTAKERMANERTLQMNEKGNWANVNRANGK